MRIAIVTDIHEDIVSLRLAFRKIEKLRADKIVCLGDISGFSVPHYQHHNTRSAHESLKMIREHCDTIILGNHDLNAIKRVPEFSPEFEYPKNWFDLDYFEKRDSSRGQVWLYEENELPPRYSKDDIAFLSSKKEMEIFETNSLSILFSHFAYPNLTGSGQEFYFDPIDFEGHFNFMQEKNCQVAITGHAHPNGLLFFTRDTMINNGFRKRKLPDEAVCVIAPSISKNGFQNGFLIFDTDKFEVEAVRI
ncbi:MAG: metallophosphoesterase [Bacteroidales bacterium]|nr:metallophosphoesterase [Bacteroidales bacterium]MCF8458245.1 metallophosphoesterase [Bacteroidales bacterium]